MVFFGILDEVAKNAAEVSVQETDFEGVEEEGLASSPDVAAP